MSDLSFRRSRFERFTDDAKILDELAKRHDALSAEEQASANEFIDSHSDEDLRREYAADLGEAADGETERPRRTRRGTQTDAPAAEPADTPEA